MSARTEGATVLERHDVSDLVGLRVVVLNAARARDEEIEIPAVDELLAAAALARCLCPARLRGREVRAIRHIVGWTAAGLAERMGERAAAATVSRWENERQPMGAHAEKVFRLLVCEELKGRAPGMVYDAGQIARLAVEPFYGAKPPLLVLDRIKLRVERGTVDAWEIPEPVLPEAA